MRSRNDGRQAGFTLLELILATFLMSVLMVVLYRIWISYLEEYIRWYSQAENVEFVQRGLREVTDVLRGTRDAEDGAWALAVAEDFEIAVFSDYDGDLVAERVRYFVEDGQLKRGVVEPSGDPVIYELANEKVIIIGTGIINQANQPVFRYYNRYWPQDQDNNPLDSGQRLLNSRFVMVDLIVDQGGDLGDSEFEMTVWVHLRNLKDDY